MNRDPKDSQLSIIIAKIGMALTLKIRKTLQRDFEISCRGL
jgi:hypothetical protein